MNGERIPRFLVSGQAEELATVMECTPSIAAIAMSVRASLHPRKLVPFQTSRRIVSLQRSRGLVNHIPYITHFAWFLRQRASSGSLARPQKISMKYRLGVWTYQRLVIKSRVIRGPNGSERCLVRNMCPTVALAVPSSLVRASSLLRARANLKFGA